MSHDIGPTPPRALVVFANSVLSLLTSDMIVFLVMKRDGMSTIDVPQSTDTVSTGEKKTKIGRAGTMHLCSAVGPLFLCSLGG